MVGIGFDSDQLVQPSTRNSFIDHYVRGSVIVCNFNFVSGYVVKFDTDNNVIYGYQFNFIPCYVVKFGSNYDIVNDQ